MTPTQTSRVLDHMLCESMGLYYAVDKEKAPTAKRRQLAAEPYGRLTGSQNECWPVVSTFHFLRDRLEYRREITTDLYRFYDSGSTLDEAIYRWGQSRCLGEAIASHTLSDAHSLDHDFRWWVFDEGEVGDQIAVVQTCDELGLSPSTPFAFRVNQLEDFFTFRRAIVHCSGSLVLAPEECEGVHVFEFTGDEWQEYLIVNEQWMPNPHDDDPFTQVLPLRGEELPNDPNGVIYYNSDWKVYHCPRCAHELDVEGPGL